MTIEINAMINWDMQVETQTLLPHFALDSISEGKKTTTNGSNNSSGDNGGSSKYTKAWKSAWKYGENKSMTT